MIGLPPIRAVADACCVGVLGVVCPLLTDRAFPLAVEVTVAETWACNGVNVIPEFWKKKNLNVFKIMISQHVTNSAKYYCHCSH